MKHFLRSRLVLTITALLMIAATVFIPLSGKISHSHAAGSSEPRLALHPSTITHHFNATTGLTTTVVTTDTPCATPTVVIPSLTQGDQVSIIAVETTTDSGEASEQEFLQLKDTSSPSTFTQPVTTFNEITPMVFNVTATSDQLTACILAGADGPDGDEQGLITYTIAHTKTITITPSMPVDNLRDDIREQVEAFPTGVDCVLDFAQDTPVMYLVKADYTLIKLDFQLATTADPDKQGAEIIDALVGLTPVLPPGVGCVQSVLGYLSPNLSDTCIVSVGACVLTIKHDVLKEK